MTGDFEGKSKGRFSGLFKDKFAGKSGSGSDSKSYDKKNYDDGSGYSFDDDFEEIPLGENDDYSFEDSDNSNHNTHDTHAGHTKSVSGNGFSDTVRSLVDGMDSFISSKTVLGEPIYLGETIVLPLIDVSFGVGAGAFGQSRENSSGNSGGGMHGKMSPSAVLVIKDGVARVVNVKDQDMISKVMGAAPDVVDKVASFVKGRGDSGSKSAKDGTKDN